MEKKFLFLIILISAFISSAFAQTPSHIIVAPTCLVNTHTFSVLAKQNNFVLLRASDKDIDHLITTKHHAKTSCGGFMDVTEEWSESKNASDFLRKLVTPVKFISKTSYSIQYQEQVKTLLTQFNPQNLWTYLSNLTSFNDRYANSDNGVTAANWLKTQVEQIAKENNRNDVTVYTVATKGYKQPSVVAKIGNSNLPGIVIGGHMDTLSGSISKKPGADDDGSGTVTVLETARVILSSNMQFKKPIYFVWYAAEEEGLVGSRNVVNEFQNKKIPVEAVIQFDMTGYANRNDQTMWLMDDYVDSKLTAYLAELIKFYVNKPINYSRCGYACSDHATWNQKGIASAIAFEAEFGKDNPDIHTSRDTMDKLSLSHMSDFAKLAIAFTVELAEPASL